MRDVQQRPLWELRRQYSVAHTNLAKWRTKSEAKEAGYLEKIARLEREIAELEAAGE